MKKMIKLFLVIIVIAICLVAILLLNLSRRMAVPNDYTATVQTGGDIEAKYLAMGEYDVSYLEMGGLHDFKKYEIYYPSNIASMAKKLPVVIFSNGTGVPASKYPALLKHLASWGFIVMATEEEYSWNGFSSEMCLRTITGLNDTEAVDAWKANPFYQRVDLKNIGVSGHSQGGGVINAVNENKHGAMIKTIFSASPANMTLAQGLQWEYDPSLINVSVFFVSSTGDSDEKLVVSGKQLQDIYDAVPDTVDKVMARRSNAEHGDMLYYADGYMTAWFMWQLQDDEYASNAFIGEDAEILSNKLYQDQNSNLQ